MQKLGKIFIAFHGCEKAVAEKVFSGAEILRPSNNKYDWLGNGTYFWVDDPLRAYDFARQKFKDPIDEPTVVGAVISISTLLDLTTMQDVGDLSEYYQNTIKPLLDTHITLPENKKSSKNNFLYWRYRDCYVINSYIQDIEQTGTIVDAVLGAYEEGNPAFPGAAQRELNHIQLAVRNPKCILGYFRLRKNDYYNLPPK